MKKNIIDDCNSLSTITVNRVNVMWDCQRYLLKSCDDETVWQQFKDISEMAVNTNWLCGTIYIVNRVSTHFFKTKYHDNIKNIKTNFIEISRHYSHVS